MAVIFHKIVKNIELKTIETLLYNIYRFIFLEASVLNIFIKQSVYKLALHVLLLKNNLFTIYCWLINTKLTFNDFPGGSDGKAFAYNAGGLGSIPGSGTSSGEGNGNPLQYSCLENPKDGRAWWATVRWVTVGHDWVTSLYLTLPHI